MQCKLFFFVFFIFSFITTTFSAKENNNNEINQKRKHLANNLQTLQTPINTFNLLNPHAKKKSTDLLNKLLEHSNIFRFIFPYLSLFELDLNFKFTSKTFYRLCEKILQEEKTILQSYFTNKKVFLENINYNRQYFDFFEKRVWKNPERIEYVNVDFCFENLTLLLPKSIKQMISFKDGNDIKYKYVLFKNGHLSILKQNLEGKFVFTCLQNDFKKIHTLDDKYFRLDSFQENCQFLIGREFPAEIFIQIYKNDHSNQYIRHAKNHLKLIVNPPVSCVPKVFLKNFSGFLNQYNTSVKVTKFEKQDNGIYTRNVIRPFKRNVKEIKSKDFEHYAQDVQFILNED